MSQKPKYKLWWNDKKAIKYQIRYGIPIIILSAIFFYFTVFNKVSFIEYIMLIGALSIFIFSFFDYILKLPSGFIEEDKDSKKTKDNIRLFLFVVGIVLAYLISIPILAKYYSFFEQFIGAQFLINHFGF